MEKKKLFLDDKRQPYDDSWILVKNYKEFVKYIDENGIPDKVSLDHDLHPEHYIKEMYGSLIDFNKKYQTFTHKTGLECADYLCRTCVDKGVEIPKVIVHSRNPNGASNIDMLVRQYTLFYFDEEIGPIVQPFKD